MRNNFSIGTILPPSANENFEVIVKYHGDIEQIAKILDVNAEILTDSYAIITLNQSQLEQLSSFNEIEYVELPKTLAFLLVRALQASCINPVHNERGLTGKGTVIGIIDSGIDYTHPDFRNADGTTRILYFWDQTAGNGVPPRDFAAGVEYSAAELNQALASMQPLEIIPSLDTIGHGTAVAGVAAGNGRASNGRFVGVAPEASLIAVRLGQRGQESFARTTEIMRAIKYIVSKATELNMPLSINLSYGTNNGSHDGNSLFETYINDMAARWKTVISVAAGNEGVAGHHYLGQAIQNSTTTVQFVTGGYFNSFYMTLWKNFADTLYFELISPDGQSTAIIRPQDKITSFMLGNINVSVIYGQPAAYNEAQEVFFQFEGINGTTISPGLWKLNVFAPEVVDGRFDIWLPVTEAVTTETAFLTPDVSTTITLPATARSVIAVGGYNLFTNAPADFSGRGYTRSIVYVKPDIVAPAVDVITASSGGGYDTYSGTSIAAPFVTGSAALLMEWGIVNGNDDYLYGQKVKALLQKGARRFSGINFPNRLWGYGALCLENAILPILEASTRRG